MKRETTKCCVSLSLQTFYTSVTSLYVQFLGCKYCLSKTRNFGLRPFQPKIPFLILDKLNKAVYIVTCIACVLNMHIIYYLDNYVVT